MRFNGWEAVVLRLGRLALIVKGLVGLVPAAPSDDQAKLVSTAEVPGLVTSVRACAGLAAMAKAAPVAARLHRPRRAGRLVITLSETLMIVSTILPEPFARWWTLHGAALATGAVVDGSGVAEWGAF